MAMKRAFAATQEASERKIREETQRAFARSLLADGFDLAFVAHYSGLSLRQTQALNRRRRQAAHVARKIPLDEKTYVEVVAPMTLMQDPLAQVCLHDNCPAVAEILRVILQRDDLEVRKVTVQKRLPGLHFHSVCFDVFAVDSEGRAYDIELQVGGSLAELIRRSRVCSAYLDTHLLRKGTEYACLAESYAIFILDRDALGHGQPLYKIDRYFSVDGVYHPFGDGAHIIFVNRPVR